MCAKKRGWRERRKVRKSEKHQTTTFQLKAYKSLQSLNEIIPSHSHSHIPAAGSAHNSTIFNFICRLMPLSYFHFRSHSVWMKYWWNFQFSKSRGKFACTQAEHWSEIFMSLAQQRAHISLSRIRSGWQNENKQKWRFQFDFRISVERFSSSIAAEKPKKSWEVKRSGEKIV